MPSGQGLAKDRPRLLSGPGAICSASEKVTKAGKKNPVRTVWLAKPESVLSGP